ncbi:hypothetical protein [uncultured Clostridium sp.]
MDEIQELSPEVIEKIVTDIFDFKKVQDLKKYVNFEIK